MRIKVQIALSEADSWHDCMPDISKLTLEYSKDDKYNFARLKFGGTITFFGADYEFIKAGASEIILLKFFQNGEYLTLATFDVNQNENKNYKKLTGAVIVKDEYTLLDKFKDKEWNVLEVERVKGGHTDSYQGATGLVISFDYSYLYVKDFEDVETSGAVSGAISPEIRTSVIISNLDANGMPSDGIIYPDGGSSGSSQWGMLKVNYYYIDILSLKNAREFVAIFAKEYYYGTYVGSEAVAPDSAGNWTFIEKITINGIDYPKFSRPITEDVTWTQDDDTVNNILSFTSEIYDKIINGSGINYYNRHRRFTDVLKFIVNKCDSTILFDESGNDNSSFYVLNIITGDYFTPPNNTTATAVGIESDRPFRDLMLLQITDAIPNADGTQKDVPATKGLMCFETIMNWLWQLGFTYRLEERTDGTYFILEHLLWSELGSGSNPNLQNYLGGNYIRKKNEIDNDPATYNILHNSEFSANIEFLGADIIYDNQAENKQEEYGQNFIFSDISDIRNRKGDVYSEQSTNQFVVLCCGQISWSGTLDYFVRNIAGTLTGGLTNNNELSFSWLAQNLLCRLPNRYLTINGVTQTIDTKRVEKRNKIKINVPVLNVKTDFTPENYIDFFGEDAEFQSLAHQANSNVGTLNLKK